MAPSFGDAISEKLIPPVLKFANLKPITALKNGMIAIMPLSIIGSIFLLLAYFPITVVATFFANAGLTPMLLQVYSATFSMIGIVACFAIAYNYVKASGHEALIAGVVAMCSYILVMDLSVTDAKTKVTISSAIDMGWTGARGMIVGIIVGEISGVIFTWFLDKKITIKLPDGVPPAVANSFTGLIPGAVILTLWMVVWGAFKAAGTNMMAAIYNVLQLPLQGLTDSLGGVIVISLAIPFLWWFGIHGSSIVGGVITPMLTANTQDNQKILDAGKELTIANGGHIVTQQFMDNFMNMTGSGVTIGIVIYMVFWAKSGQYKTLGKLAVGPAAFNINEPITFGTPIVMNPIMAIPFMLTPLVVALLEYFALALGLIPLYKGIMAPWTMPPILSGFIVGDWRTALLQAVALAISVAMYLPFIRKADQLLLAEEEAAEAESAHELVVHEHEAELLAKAEAAEAAAKSAK